MVCANADHRGGPFPCPRNTFCVASGALAFVCHALLKPRSAFRAVRARHLRPQTGKALLQAVVDAILMQPTPDGYAVRVTLKSTNPAALVEDSGVGDSERSCGGLLVQFDGLDRRYGKSCR